MLTLQNEFKSEQYCKVISLQLIKINGKKKKEKGARDTVKKKKSAPFSSVFCSSLGRIGVNSSLNI